MLGNGHVRFGGRVRETDQAQARHRALTRPNTELKQRGVQDILICCIDGLKGFPEAIEAVFPKTTVQTCIVHLIRRSLKYVPRREYEKVARDLKPIYTAIDADHAHQELERFDEKWGARFPVITQAWLDRWEYLTPFLAFAPEVRRVIYTTDESVKPRVRIRTAARACGGVGCLREGRSPGGDAGETGSDRRLGCQGRRDRRRVAASFAAGCQLALRLGVGVVDPRAKRRFWD
jgi:hypothetical protein